MAVSRREFFRHWAGQHPARLLGRLASVFAGDVTSSRHPSAEQAGLALGSSGTISPLLAMVRGAASVDVTPETKTEQTEPNVLDRLARQEPDAR